MTKSTRSLAAAGLAAALVIAACGGDDGEEGAAGGETTAAEGAETTAAEGGGGSEGGAVDCQPIEDGVLTVVTSLPGPNFWGSGEATPDEISSGLEYDLATLIAEACGLTMEFRNENFDAIVAGQIPEDSYDIIFSQVTIREERDEVVDFTVSYFKSDQGILVQEGTTIESFDDLAPLAVGVQAGTTAEFFFSEEGPWAGTLENGTQSFPDLTAAYAALSAGQVDAVVIDTAINLGQAAASDGALVVPAQMVTGEEYGAIVPEGSPKKAIFDDIMQGLIDDGTVAELTAEYLGGDPGEVPVIEVPAGG
jgi:polar amino acid transport system substrate-binding protein